MTSINKNIFLSTLSCPTLGWLHRNGLTSTEPTLAERFRMGQGVEVGRRARSMFPTGTLIDSLDINSASTETKNLMDSTDSPTLFEATFLVDNYVTKADILVRLDNGWHIIEVKSSVNDKPEYIDDMAYTAMVIKRAGYGISKASLLLVSKDFRLGMDITNLFVEIDHTEAVLNKVDTFLAYWEQVDNITAQPDKPEPDLIFDCKNCELFAECIGAGIDNHIFDLPRLSKNKFDILKGLGIECIEDIPDDFDLTDFQERVVESVKSSQINIGEELSDELNSVVFPAYYLDFETLMTAIPLYPEIAPFTQIPTQYSIHICSAPGKVVEHLEYLADPSRDCRKELAANLINDLCDSGSIIVYSGFEKSIINGLIMEYTELSESLTALIDRLVDMEEIIKKHFYHLGFHGKTSIKKTLPALVPEMSYEGLDISDGGSAMTEFAYMAMGKYSDEEMEKVRRNLLEYCGQDSMAMVRIHEKLVEYVC